MPGRITAKVTKSILAALPLDITFIDENDIIRYYSDYRIFKRTPEIIGTSVHDCHPPKSRAAVNKVIDDLKSGRADVVAQPATKGGRPVMVRYSAVRSPAGEYLGLVEICQWINAKHGKAAGVSQTGT